MLASGTGTSSVSDPMRLRRQAFRSLKPDSWTGFRDEQYNDLPMMTRLLHSEHNV